MDEDTFIIEIHPLAHCREDERKLNKCFLILLLYFMVYLTFEMNDISFWESWPRRLQLPPNALSTNVLLRRLLVRPILDTTLILSWSYLWDQCSWERKVPLSLWTTSYLVIDLIPAFKLTPFNQSNTHMKRKMQVSLNMQVLLSQLDLRQSGLHFLFSNAVYEDQKSPSFVRINSLRWRAGLSECRVPRFYLDFFPKLIL